MKLSRLVMIGILALAAPLAACGGIQSLALDTTHTTIQQASTVKAAGDLFVLADHAGTAYFNSGHADKDVTAKLVKVEAGLYAALNGARQADARGDSPATGAALAVFNANYADLRKLLPGG